MSDLLTGSSPTARLAEALAFIRRLRGYRDTNQPRIGFLPADLAAARQAAGLEDIPIGDDRTVYSDQLIVPLTEAAAQIADRLEELETLVRTIRSYDGEPVSRAEHAFDGADPVLLMKVGPLSFVEALIETPDRVVPLSFTTARANSITFVSNTSLEPVTHCFDSLGGWPLPRYLTTSIQDRAPWRIGVWDPRHTGVGNRDLFLQILRGDLDASGVFVVNGDDGAYVFGCASTPGTMRVSVYRRTNIVEVPTETSIWSRNPVPSAQIPIVFTRRNSF